MTLSRVTLNPRLPSLKLVYDPAAKKLNNSPACSFLTFSGFTTDLSAYTELANFWLTFFIMSVVALVVILLILIFLRKRFAIDNLFLQTSSKPRFFLQNTDRHRADRGGLDRRGRHHVHSVFPRRPVPPAARRHRLLHHCRHVSGFIWGTQLRFAGRPRRR